VHTVLLFGSNCRPKVLYFSKSYNTFRAQIAKYIKKTFKRIYLKLKLIFDWNSGSKSAKFFHEKIDFADQITNYKNAQK
jgi:hypothetical protein